MSKKKHEAQLPSTGFLLWQVNNLWQRSMKSTLERAGITHVQFLLLEALQRAKRDSGSLSQAKLAQLAGTDVMMTSKVLRTMESKKLVQRKSRPADSRSNTVTLTALGEKALGKARAMVEANDENFFGKLPKPGKFEKSLRILAEENA